MAAPRKSKADALRATRQNPPQPAEEAQGTKQGGPDYSEYREPETVTISARIDPRDRRAIERYAAERGLKLAQVVRVWLLERMQREGLK
jgi:flagellar biosynthesis/type III secretory pathway M-ring protein FliF/YscJ